MRNSTVFQDFGTKYTVGYTFSKIGIRSGILFQTIGIRNGSGMFFNPRLGLDRTSLTKIWSGQVHLPGFIIKCRLLLQDLCDLR